MASNPETGGDGKTGFMNLKNTCYMNTVFQALSHSVPLRNYCIDVPLDLLIVGTQPTSHQGWLAYYFILTVRQLWSNKYSSLIPIRLRRMITVHRPDFAEGLQQDATEMLRAFIHQLHDDLSQAAINVAVPPQLPLTASLHEIAARAMTLQMKDKGTSIMSQLFGHFKVDIVQCGNPSCLKPRYQVTPDYIIDLNLEERERDSLTSLLDRYQTLQDTDVSLTCDTCGQQTVSKKGTCFWNLPQILIITFGRVMSFYNIEKGEQDSIKYKFPIEYPIEGLDMSLYCHPSNRPYSSESLYDLFAVIQHHGDSFAEGHYIAACRTSEGTGPRDWTLFNDSYLESAKTTDVLTHHAYSLFYRKRRSQRRETQI